VIPLTNLLKAIKNNNLYKSEIMQEEKKKSFMDKMSNDPNSLVGKMQSGMGADFLEGIISKITPFIDPMIDGVAESLGDDEIMCLLRKNKKDGKLYVHVIETASVTKFELKEGAIKQVIDGKEFINTVLSGNLDLGLSEDK
jgi:hypothetical protein